MLLDVSGQLGEGVVGFNRSIAKQLLTKSINGISDFLLGRQQSQSISKPSYFGLSVSMARVSLTGQAISQVLSRSLSGDVSDNSRQLSGQGGVFINIDIGSISLDKQFGDNVINFCLQNCVLCSTHNLNPPKI